MPIPVTVTVPKFGKCEDLVQAVSVSCSLRDDETLLLAEVCVARSCLGIRELFQFVSLCIILSWHHKGEVAVWS